MNIENKKIVITGASSGIGKEILKKLSDYNCEIVAVSLEEKKLIKTISEINSNAKIIPFVCDLGQKEEVDRLFKFCDKEVETIDIFISNAGFAYYEEIRKADWSHIEKIFNVNVFASIYAAEIMKEKYADKPYYFLATASSIAHMAIPGYALYGATKAALDRFAEAYRYELSPKSTFALLYPIATRTNFFKRAGDNIPKPFISQSAEYVAKKVILGIENNKASIYPSRLFLFMMFVNRFCKCITNWYKNKEYKKFLVWVKRK